MLLNPFYPLSFLTITSLKTTIFFLLILLIKSNLLRLKGGLIGALFALLLISGIILSSSLALASLAYAYRVKTKSKRTDDTEDIEDIDTLETVNI